MGGGKTKGLIEPKSDLLEYFGTLCLFRRQRRKNLTQSSLQRDDETDCFKPQNTLSMMFCFHLKMFLYQQNLRIVQTPPPPQQKNVWVLRCGILREGRGEKCRDRTGLHRPAVPDLWPLNATELTRSSLDANFCCHGNI